MTDLTAAERHATAEDLIAAYDILTLCLMECVEEPYGPSLQHALDEWREVMVSYKAGRYRASCEPSTLDGIFGAYERACAHGRRESASYLLYGAAIAMRTTTRDLLTCRTNGDAK